MKKTVATVMIIFIIWASPYLKNEFLTFLHGNEFIRLELPSMIEPVYHLKVLSYSNNSAVVYYVGGTGDVLSFTRNNENWERVSWHTVWSSGSADDFIWPYFYHSPEGIGFFVIIVIIISLFVNVCSYLIKITRRIDRH